MVVQYTYLVSPDFGPTVVPEGYTWDETAFQELVKATDKATADETIYVYGGPQGDTNVDYLNAADLTISSQKYDSEEVVATTVTANAFNNIGTVTTDGGIVFSVKSFFNSGTFDLDKNASMIATSGVTNAVDGTISLNAGSTLEGSTIGNAGTITVVSDHAAINGAITNNGTIDALMKKLIVVGDIQNANEDEPAEARNNTVITARELEVSGNVLNYGVIGLEYHPIHEMSVSGELNNYRQVIADVLTAGSIYSDGYYPEAEERHTRGYIIAGEVNAGSIDNVSGVVMSKTPKETAAGINVTGAINNGNADNVYAHLNAGINGWIQAASLNNIGTDIENSLIDAGKITVGDVTNSGGISTRIVESTGTITNNETGLFYVSFIDDPVVTGLVEAASINADTVINGGTFSVHSEETLPTEITVTSIENNGTFEFIGAGSTLTGDVVNNAQLDVAGTVTASGTITNTETGTIDLKEGSILQSTAIDNAGTMNVSGTLIGVDISVGSVSVSDGGAVVNTEVGSGGSLLVSGGGKITGTLTVEAGAVVSAEVGSVLEFDISGIAPEASALVNDLSLVQGTPDYTVKVSATQAGGTYNLAAGAAAFTGSMEVCTDDTCFGSITVGSTVEFAGRSYTLNLTDALLSFTVGATVPADDLNGDGRADIMMTITPGNAGEGATGAWLIQEDQTAAWGDLSQLSSGSELFGTGKTSADKATFDVYVRTSDNVIGAWTTGSEGQVTSWQTIGAFDSETNVLGIGDFNGDGQSDLLLRNDNGAVGCYLTGGEKAGWNYIQSFGDEWAVAAIGDLNSDGISDIVLRNAQGYAGTWLVQEDTSVVWAELDTLSDDFEIVGTGDFNSDGTDDVLLKKESYYGAWLTEDGRVKDWFGLGDLGEVAVEQISDFDGDGTDDLRIRTTAGDVGALLVCGEDDLDWQHYGSVGSEWSTSLAAL